MTIAEERAFIRQYMWKAVDERQLCLSRGDVVSANAYRATIARYHETLRELCCTEMASAETCCLFTGSMGVKLLGPLLSR